MTDDEARQLKSGDKVRLRVTAGMPHPTLTIFTVARVEARPDDVRIVTTDGSHLVPWEIEKYEREGRP